MERVTELNEVKILGYFESIRGTFLVKFIVLIGCTKFDGQLRQLNVGAFDPDALKAAEELFPDDCLYKAIANGNRELVESLEEDLITSAVIAAWAVFELVLKNATKRDYVLDPKKLPVDLAAGHLGLDQKARDDLELFYYVRNAIAHYNGAYYSAKSIDRVYHGATFKSAGNEGVKIETSIPVVWGMLKDLELSSMAVWSNSIARPTNGR